MDEYKKPYLTLFNAVTNAIDVLTRNDSSAAMEILVAGQQSAEAAYIEMSEQESLTGKGNRLTSQ